MRSGAAISFAQVPQPLGRTCWNIMMAPSVIAVMKTSCFGLSLEWEGAPPVQSLRIPRLFSGVSAGDCTVSIYSGLNRQVLPPRHKCGIKCMRHKMPPPDEVSHELAIFHLHYIRYSADSSAGTTLTQTVLLGKARTNILWCRTLSFCRRTLDTCVPQAAPHRKSHQGALVKR